MKEISLAIAGVGLRVVAHGPAAPHLFPELAPLLKGFLVRKHASPDAVCLVHFDHERIYRHRFDTEPRLLLPERSPLAALVGARVEDIFPGDRHHPAVMIGFLNGVLIFEETTRRGTIYIFYAEPDSHFPATLWKLLFVFACLVMVHRDRIIVHGAGIKKEGGGYLFLGRSGAGKSTVASLSAPGVILSDDATAVAVAGDGNSIHATPFTQLGTKRGRRPRYREEERLAGLFFLHQSAVTAIAPREERLAFVELLQAHLHGFAVMGEATKRKAFDLCRRVCATTPAYDLFFRKDPGFWELAGAPGKG